MNEPMNTGIDQGHELGWDAEIKNDSAEFILFPEGDYPFVVTALDRARHNGSEKLPPCWKAIVSLKFTDENGQTATVKHNLFLHSKCEGLLCSFFTAIGQRKHGEALRMDWGKVIGSRGKARLTVREYVSQKDGQTYKCNDVNKFLEPDAATPVVPPAQPVQTAAAAPAQPATWRRGSF